MVTIDVHAHYTQAPPELFEFRGLQLTSLNKPSRRALRIPDSKIALSLEGNLAQMTERGIDYVAFSPRASGMGHDIGGPEISLYWTQVSNDLIGRAAALFPDALLPVCQLPQAPGVPPEHWLEELYRCVETMGFVGCIINPDISGGLEPFTPSLSSEWWDPLWQAMVELDVPGMVHASSTRNPAFHVNGSHYIAQHYAATIELCASDVFARFPTLKLIMPHGGGGVPFQLNRHRALHQIEGLPRFDDAVHNLYFDTAVYDPASLELLIRNIGPDRIVFASEMFGTADTVDETRGRKFDDILPDIHGFDWLDADALQKVLGGNAMKLFSRARFAAGS